MKIIPPETFKASSWSGGKTTELFIHPQGATYQNRDFKFRISTATVAVEYSEFTALPGISRTLMLLSGKVELQHQGHHTKWLTPYDTDEFMGDWKTTSRGTCIDLNLMCNKGVKGKLYHRQIESGKTYRWNLKGEMNFFYVAKGNLYVEGIKLFCDTLVLLEPLKNIEIKASSKADLACFEISNT